MSNTTLSAKYAVKLDADFDGSVSLQEWRRHFIGLLCKMSVFCNGDPEVAVAGVVSEGGCGWCSE